MKCYARLVKIKSGQTTSAVTIQNAKLDTEKAVYLWTGFNSLQCVQCLKFKKKVEDQQSGRKCHKNQTVCSLLVTLLCPTQTMAAE